MKTIQETKYICEACGSKFEKESEAKKCESYPIIDNKKPKVGDKVRINCGDGFGNIGIVVDVGFTSYDDYFPHTVCITAKLDGPYSRVLYDYWFEIVERS